MSSSDTSVTFADCGPIITLTPGFTDTSSCSVHKTLLQQAFDDMEARGATLGFTLDIAATPAVAGMTVTKDLSAATVSGLELPVTRQMTITTSLDKTAVAATGELCGLWEGSACVGWLAFVELLPGGFTWTFIQVSQDRALHASAQMSEL
jgi:hypothetical protein